MAKLNRGQPQRDRDYELLPQLERAGAGGGGASTGGGGGSTRQSLQPSRRSTLRFALLLVPSLFITLYFLKATPPTRGRLSTSQAAASSSSTTFSADNNCALLSHSPPTPFQFSPTKPHFESPSLPLPLSAPLADRIKAWRSTSPSAPRSKWVEFNNKTCNNPSVRRSANKLHEEQGEKMWSLQSEEEIKEVRERLISVLEEASASGQLSLKDSEKGKRGIVFTAGNADTFERVIVSLRIIRSYGTELPAELWHFAEEEPTSAQMFEYNKLGCVVRTVPVGKGEEEGRSKSFHVKGAAMVGCGFEEFIYLDSDSIPARDVTPLFDSPAFKEYGAIFWPDFWKDQVSHTIKQLLPLPANPDLFYFSPSTARE
ncbi:hypothetical protein P7C70_g9285, partial [Phenoliferia sp. Uapishka_3]